MSLRSAQGRKKVARFLVKAWRMPRQAHSKERQAKQVAVFYKHEPFRIWLQRGAGDQHRPSAVVAPSSFATPKILRTDPLQVACVHRAAACSSPRQRPRTARPQSRARRLLQSCGCRLVDQRTKSSPWALGRPTGAKIPVDVRYLSDPHTSAPVAYAHGCTGGTL
jgi:hypothetical protein